LGLEEDARQMGISLAVVNDEEQLPRLEALPLGQIRLDVIIGV
jgi:hypothetical protein